MHSLGFLYCFPKYDNLCITPKEAFGLDLTISLHKKVKVHVEEQAPISDKAGATQSKRKLETAVCHICSRVTFLC